MALTFGELHETPLGVISFISSEKGIQHISFGSLKQLKEALKITDKQPSLNGLLTISAFLVELNEFINGIRKIFTIPIDWHGIKGFQREVLEFIMGIPYGEVITYGGVAQQLGKPGGARAVGNVLLSNPMPLLIPCHRIVGSKGDLRGYQGGIEAKVYLLRLEGHQINGCNILIKQKDLG